MDGGARILIVEDDPRMGRLLTRMLRSRLQGECVVVTSVAAAKAVLAERTWTAAIVDVVLPDGSGFDVVIEARRVAPVLPVLVMTGHGELVHANRAQALRAEFVYKPASRENILPFVERAVAVGVCAQERVAVAIRTLAHCCDLSKRETEVVRLAVAGVSHKGICGEFGVRPSTLKTQVHRLLRKTGETDLDALVASVYKAALHDALGDPVTGRDSPKAAAR